MARDTDIQNTLKGTDLGGSEGEASPADLDRGYFDAGPKGNYEGTLDPTKYIDTDGKEFKIVEGGTLHAGQIEPDMYLPEHGDEGQFGFVRRPVRDTDVERN